MQYKHYGANMMPSHAVNHATGTNNVEPALEEMRNLMYAGQLTIGAHNTELLEELRAYHRDENYRIVKQRDDLVSALRYAIMMKRSGKPLSECDGVHYGHAVMPFAGQVRDRSREPKIARGVDFDLF
jgi:hypothetical protein